MRATVARGLASGAAMIVTTAAATMIASSLARSSPWAGLNAMATAVGVGGRRPRARFDPAVTPVGIAVLAGGLLLGGLLCQGALAGTRRRGLAPDWGPQSTTGDDEVAAVQRPPADS